MLNKSIVQTSLVIISLLLLSGCGPKDFENFQNEAVKSAQGDNKIDENEYNKLAEIILKSSDPRLKDFKKSDQEVDDPKVVQYLLKLLKTRNLTLSEKDIITPGKYVNSPFNINVYIENSASMDGYVKGVTEFETAIYNLLGDLKISESAKTLNLNYINNEVTFTKENALPPDIQDFIEKLEPNTFKERGGNRSTSDIKNILAAVLEKTDSENLGILISDFVFSPGKDRDAQDYLNNQTVGIKLDFAGKLKKFDLATIVIQMQSEFDGTYYDKNNRPISISGKRPYYIWIIGSTTQIQSITDKKILDSIKGGYQHRIIFSLLKEPTSAEYKILLSNKIGNFRLSDGTKGPINEATVSKSDEKKNSFGFEVAVDFSKYPQDAKYFTDPANYRLSSSNYTLTVELINEGDQTTQGFTHKLKLETKELRDETLKIEVIGKLPMWVENSSSNDDTNIGTDKGEMNKTFGLKQLIEGVSEAFYPPTNDNVISVLSIPIKK